MRYLVEHGRADTGVAVARACRAERWWCAALRGLALHAAGDFAAAEAVFDTALGAMPADKRCRWTDMSLLLEGRLRDRYRRLPCVGRHDLEARLWRLAQPLFLLPGNDRRTEHLARVTMARIQEEARNAYGLRWGADLAEILVRYGWEVGWTQDLPPPGSASERRIAGHHRTPSFHFLPASPDGGWAPRAPRPRESYAPVYATSFASLRHQAAFFRRGDSGVVVTAYDFRDDTLLRSRAVEVALGLVPEGDTALVVARRAEGESSRGVMTARVGWAPVIVAIEALARSTRRAARARDILHPWPADGPLEVSHLLLFDPTDSLPRDLEETLPHMRGHTDIGPARIVGLFWEVYGLGPGIPVTYALSVTRVGGGWLRRAAEAVGLAGRPTPVRLRWQEVPIPVASVSPRALVVDLSAAGRGRYAIELTVSAPGLGAATATREVRLVSGDNN